MYGERSGHDTYCDCDDSSPRMSAWRLRSFWLGCMDSRGGYLRFASLVASVLEEVVEDQVVIHCFSGSVLQSIKYDLQHCAFYAWSTIHSQRDLHAAGCKRNGEVSKWCHSCAVARCYEARHASKPTDQYGRQRDSGFMEP